MRVPVALVMSLLVLGPECAHSPPGPEGPRVVVQEEGTRGGTPYVKLAFRPAIPAEARERLTPEEARVLVEFLEEALERPQWRALLGVSHPQASHTLSAVPENARERWKRILGEYKALYGSSEQPLPEALLEDEKFATALKLSIKYMPQGMRVGAEELFSSRTLMGVSVGAADAAATAALASPRTSGNCRPESNKSSARRHHIATDKNSISDATGGPWTPKFEVLFRRADVTLDDPVNIIYLLGHQGPHPEPYHDEVYRRLETALGSCRNPAECRKRLITELDRIAAEICRPGAYLYKLLTK